MEERVVLGAVSTVGESLASVSMVNLTLAGLGLLSHSLCLIKTVIFLKLVINLYPLIRTLPLFEADLPRPNFQNVEAQQPKAPFDSPN